MFASERLCEFKSNLRDALPIGTTLAPNFVKVKTLANSMSSSRAVCVAVPVDRHVARRPRPLLGALPASVCCPHKSWIVPSRCTLTAAASPSSAEPRSMSPCTALVQVVPPPCTLLTSVFGDERARLTCWCSVARRLSLESRLRAYRAPIAHEAKRRWPGRKSMCGALSTVCSSGCGSHSSGPSDSGCCIG